MCFMLSTYTSNRKVVKGEKRIHVRRIKRIILNKMKQANNKVTCSDPHYRDADSERGNNHLKRKRKLVTKPKEPADWFNR